MEEVVTSFHNYLLDQKCKDIAVFNVRIEGQNVSCIVATQPNVIENKKLADKILADFSIEEFPEGYCKGEWIIFDFQDVVLNCFIPSVREKFNLEKLWQKEKVQNIIKDTSAVKKSKKAKDIAGNKK